MSITGFDYTHRPAPAAKFVAAKDSKAPPSGAEPETAAAKDLPETGLSPLYWAAIAVGLLLNVLWVGAFAWLAAKILIMFI